MQVFITGGTGLIGSLLSKTLLGQGHGVTVLTRNPAEAQKKLGTAVQCCTSLNELSSLDAFDAVVNLAGEPIAPGRWTAERKKSIAESRWGITAKLARLIQIGENPPSVFVSGSAVGYYGNHGDEVLNESAKPKADYLNSVCVEWERLALQAASDKTRVCISRTGIILSSKGGMLAKLLPVFKRYLGGVVGGGAQYISWVHRHDMIAILLLLLQNENAHGVYNLTAPKPVTNKVFSQEFARSLQRPCFFTIPPFAIRLAMGEAASMLLEGQRVSSQKITDLGYQFSFPNITQAFKDIADNSN